MAEVDESSRRARRAQRSHRRHRNLRIAAVLAIVVAIVGGVVAVVAARDSTAENSSTTPPTVDVPQPSSSAGPTDANQSVVALKHAQPPRPLSHADPLRVWVGGDSLSGELGPALGDLLSPTGIVRVTVDFKVGSGLHDDGLRNWPREVAAQMASYQPEAAIFMVGANDASIVGGDASSWEPAYRAKVGRVMDLLVGDKHRTVFWVSPPPLRQIALDTGVRALAVVMRQEAAKRPDVVFVDAYSMFAGADGGYTDRLDLSSLTTAAPFTVTTTASTGSLADVRVRNTDGVHFSDAGAEWIAYKMAVLLDERWDIARQAGGAPISVTIERGGGTIPGYTWTTYHRRWSTTTYHSTSTTASATTVATTAPATTATTPPTTTPKTTATTPKTTAPNEHP